MIIVLQPQTDPVEDEGLSRSHLYINFCFIVQVFRFVNYIVNVPVAVKNILTFTFFIVIRISFLTIVTFF